VKLVQFSVSNFRSITSAHKIPISKTTVLIGRNNEGKSNVLKALSIAMEFLLELAFRERRKTSKILRKPRLRSNDNTYNWERDFPIAIQNRRGVKQSIFKLDFELSDTEILAFQKEIKSNLNGTLPLEIRIGEDDIPAIKVSKSGRGSKTLNSKSGIIADFIAKRIFFNYIPAIRTDKEALLVISEMLSQELTVLEKDQRYLDAIEVIADLQKPILKDLARRIKEPLSEFLPEIKRVRIDIADNGRRQYYRRDFEVIVDDGTPTNIEYKGDGVKSLAALGLLKNRSLIDGASVIAIEEPESHLHPAAIHQLNEIINSLAEKNQVIITTHNPLFVDRLDIKTNIIIEKGNASPAKGVQQIRDLLGIKASDNLISANYALVVEGEEDKIALLALLPTLSKKLSKAINSNLLVIEPIGGAGNLPYKLSLMKNALCVYHVLLDSDDAGRKAFEKAKIDNLISIKNCTFINCRGMANAEFEDTISPKVYEAKILSEYSVDLSSTKFRGSNKWSDRMKNVFMDQGKLWNDNVEMEVKAVVSKCVANSPKISLHEHKRNSIDALVTAMENIIQS
jgi:AAA15 family ATPase/GTPase